MDFLGPRHAAPRKPGAYVRISSDPLGEERGIERQIADTEAKAKQLGWGNPIVYAENDTSAFRRRKIQLPDGTTAMRVVRPVFRQALNDLQAGVIDGLLVYDIDRLVRDPRDLEDLVDVCVEHQRPVQAVTTNLDLLSPDGQVMARMLVNFAHKSSQDTSRRVTRALAEKARQGEAVSSNRPFGWNEDRRTLSPEEAPVLREAVLCVARGGSLTEALQILKDSGVKPVRAKEWTLSSLRDMIRRPSLAGIASYMGKGRSNPPVLAEWRRATLRDEKGEYILGNWEALITPQEWEAANTELDKRRGTRRSHGKSLLSGIARCGLCGTRLNIGMDRSARVYRCTKASGGCAKISRVTKTLDNYILAVISKRLETLEEIEVKQRSGATSPEASEVQQRIEKLRTAYTQGTISDETFFTMIPELEAQLALLRREASKEIKISHSTAEMQQLWDNPSSTVAWRRGVLSQLVLTVKIMPAGVGRRIFNPEKEVEIVWR